MDLQKTTSYIGLGLASAALVAHLRWRQTLSAVNTTLPSPVPFLSPAAYRALRAIVDALIPSYDSVSADDVFAELHDTTKYSLFNGELGPNIIDLSFLTKNDEVSKAQREHLRRGALSSKCDEIAAKTFQAFITPDVQAKLSMFLATLENPVGCLALTGYFAAFSQLSLRDRTKALIGMRDSFIPDIRGAYQNIKRVVGNLFLAYCERESRNPSWGALGYDPKFPMKSKSNDEGKRACSQSRVIYLDSRENGKYNNDKSKLLALDGSHFDAVVIGSGPGGGTVAAELVAQGFDVLVLEKGGCFEQSDFLNWSETESFARTYDQGGLLASADGNVIVLAGSCVGGGSTINWNASLRTPRHVLNEWNSMGLEQFREGGDFDRSLEHSLKTLGVNTKFSYRPRGGCGTEGPTDCYESSDGHGKCDDTSFVVNDNNHALFEAADKLKYPASRIPRNTKNCVDCGSCCHGCPHDSKMTSYTALLRPLLTGQEQINVKGRLVVVPNCLAKKIITKKLESKNDQYTSKAEGVEIEVSLFADSDIGPTREQPASLLNMKVYGKVIVAACGSIQTPALLLRSGLKNDRIGRGLTLHPVAAVGGYTKVLNSDPDLKPSDMLTLSRGVGMGVIVYPPSIYPLSKKAGAKINDSENDRNYGVAIETPPLHPGLLGLILPWAGGILFKLSMLWHSKLSAFIGIARDKSCDSNRVTIDSLGNPVINYQVTKEDERVVLDGLKEQLRLMYSSGADIFFPIHEHFPWFLASKGVSADGKVQKASDEELNNYLNAIDQEGIKPFRLQIFSAHQMSSCRLASSPDKGPLRPTGATWECQSLFVADGSTLPTSLGINPMITIFAMGHYISGNIIKELRK